RTDHARGLGALVTVRASTATATQRAGRSGREGPGRVYRCWSQVDHDRLPEHGRPEIAIADLTGFALELACWGHPDGSGLRLLDNVDRGASSRWREAAERLAADSEAAATQTSAQTAGTGTSAGRGAGDPAPAGRTPNGRAAGRMSGSPMPGSGTPMTDYLAA